MCICGKSKKFYRMIMVSDGSIFSFPLSQILNFKSHFFCFHFYCYHLFILQRINGKTFFNDHDDDDDFMFIQTFYYLLVHWSLKRTPLFVIFFHSSYSSPFSSFQMMNTPIYPHGIDYPTTLLFYTTEENQ